MANPQLKTREPVGSAVDKQLLSDLRAYSKETGIPISKLLDKSIKMFLDTIKDH